MEPAAAKPKDKPPYVPFECQVHTCREMAVAYCERMYLCVCAKHRAEFCIPDKHQLSSLEDGLRRMITEAESNIQSSKRYIERLRLDLKRYRKHLAAIGAPDPEAHAAPSKQSEGERL